MFFAPKKGSSSDPTPEGGLTQALRRKDFGMIFDWFTTYFFRGATLCFILIIIATVPSKQWDSVRIVGLSFIFACACTVCGWLLGLLFGIPRTLSRPQATPVAAGGATGTPAATPAAGSPTGAAGSANRVNTNLEDVSDWLTKTLVGVGLTQLYFVPHYLWQSADKINKAGFMWDGSGQLLAIALFLYFAPGGFWLGYIGTRTILTKLFDSLEAPSQNDVDKALKPDQLKLDLDGKIKPPDNPEIKAADAAILNFQVTSLNTPRELGAWGAAKARANDLGSASFALEKATHASPSDPVLREALAKVYTAQSRKPEAQQLLQNDQDSEVALLNALYEDSPAGFTKAIAIGSRLKQAPGAEKKLNLHIWLACAYGQQHKFASTNDAALAESARKNAVAEIETALNIDVAKAKPWLRALWQPQPGSQEDDLASIPKDDPDLTRLLL